MCSYAGAPPAAPVEVTFTFTEFDPVVTSQSSRSLELTPPTKEPSALFTAAAAKLLLCLIEPNGLARGPRSMSIVALSELLGASVRDASGTVRGRVREVAVAPQDHPTRVAYLIVGTGDGERVLPASDVKSCSKSVRADTDAASWETYTAS